MAVQNEAVNRSTSGRSVCKTIGHSSGMEVVLSRVWVWTPHHYDTPV